MKQTPSQIIAKQMIGGHIQVYNIWVCGRDIDDNNQHFPITPKNIDVHDNWHSDLKKACSDFFKVRVKDKDSEHGYYSEIYSDYIVVFYSIDINIKDFENRFDLDFNLDCEKCQEMIPYYCDYDFNVVDERVSLFN